MTTLAAAVKAAIALHCFDLHYALPPPYQYPKMPEYCMYYGSDHPEAWGFVRIEKPCLEVAEKWIEVRENNRLKQVEYEAQCNNLQQQIKEGTK
jgi:hypothetical protein